MKIATQWKKRAKHDRKFRAYYKIRNRIILLILDLKDKLIIQN